MKNLVVFLFIWIASHLVHAQSFKFEHSQDSLTVDKNIETLANQLLQLEYSDENENDLDNLFRFYIAAKDYDNGLLFLKKLQKYYEDSYGEFHHIIGIQYVYTIKAKKI